MNLDSLWSLFLQWHIATEETMKLIIAINGNKIKTYMDILYAKTGCRTWEQFLNSQLYQ